MSVDVEDWFQVWALSRVIDRSNWDTHVLRVESTTRRILDMFDAHDATATFFVLGWIAERCPDLVRQIAARGHEIASHGWDHTKVFDQDRAAFTEDVAKTRRLLTELSGQPCLGFRAAGFSIDRRTPFAHAVLAETGYRYSSSSHPIAHDHYGDPDAPLGPRRVSGIAELPVAVVDVAGRRQSCAGGGWFRALPYSVSKVMWRRLERQGRKGIFYFHPWEIDPAQPKPRGLDLKSKVRHRINLARMEGKLERLLADFRWGRIDEVFADEIAATGDRASAA